MRILVLELTFQVEEVVDVLLALWVSLWRRRG
jgi:hypothetical protein